MVCFYSECCFRTRLRSLQYVFLVSRPILACPSCPVASTVLVMLKTSYCMSFMRLQWVIGLSEIVVVVFNKIISVVFTRFCSLVSRLHSLFRFNDRIRLVHLSAPKTKKLSCHLEIIRECIV